MIVYKCATHGVRLHIEGNRRTIQTPPGSYVKTPHCILMTTPEPKAGKFGDCEVVKEA